MPVDLAAVLELSIPERLRWVEALWNSIAAEPQAVAVTDWQKELLAERKAEYLRDPSIAVPWEEARARILGSGRD